MLDMAYLGTAMQGVIEACLARTCLLKRKHAQYNTKSNELLITASEVCWCDIVWGSYIGMID